MILIVCFSYLFLPLISHVLGFQFLVLDLVMVLISGFYL